MDKHLVRKKIIGLIKMEKKLYIQIDKYGLKITIFEEEKSCIYGDKYLHVG